MTTTPILSPQNLSPGFFLLSPILAHLSKHTSSLHFRANHLDTWLSEEIPNTAPFNPLQAQAQALTTKSSTDSLPVQTRYAVQYMPQGPHGDRPHQLPRTAVTSDCKLGGLQQ